MKTIKLLLALLLTGITTTQAQTIIGKLIDENHVPLEYANIILLSPTDSSFVQGTITNTDGDFILDKVNGKAYILKASSVGYKTIYKKCQSGNIGTLTLKSDAILLQEAVVTACRPTYKMKGNALVTHVSNSLLSTAGTANDVLAHIPFVQGDNGQFTVFGKGTPLIYLNGRQLRDLSELERLSSKDVQSVEVITNPGAEYDVTVKSVIKIKTVKPKGEGFSTNIHAGIIQDHNFNHFEQLNMNYRHGGLDLFANIYYSHMGNYQEQKDKHYIEVDTLWQHRSEMDMNAKSHYINTEGGFNYMINSDHSLGARYTFNRSPKSKLKMTSDYEIIADGSFYDKQHYDYDWNNNDFSHRINAYYLGSMGKLGIDFNADYYSGETRQYQNVLESSEEYEDRHVTASNLNDNRLYAAKLVLAHPIGKGEVKAGAEYSHTRRLNRYENPQNYLPETDNEIKEDKLAGFAEFAIALGKLQASAGFRFEHVTSEYLDKGKRIEEQSRDYDNLFPNVSFALPVGKTQLSFSYTAKTRRPSYNELSSNLQYDDRFTYEGGNPNLKPETIHDLTFMGNYQWIQLFVSYQQRRDAIEFVAESYDKNPAITLFTRKNFDKIEALNTGLVLSPKFGIWEPSLSLQMQQQFFKNMTMGSLKHFNRPIFNGRLDNYFRFSKTCTGNLTLFYRSKGNRSIMLMKPNQGVNISLNKTFMNDRMNVNLRVNDIFASQRSSYIIYGDCMQFDKWNYSDTRNVRLTVSYKFNSTRSKYRGTGAANEELNRL